MPTILIPCPNCGCGSVGSGSGGSVPPFSGGYECRCCPPGTVYPAALCVTFANVSGASSLDGLKVTLRYGGCNDPGLQPYYGGISTCLTLPPGCYTDPGLGGLLNLNGARVVIILVCRWDPGRLSYQWCLTAQINASVPPCHDPPMGFDDPGSYVVAIIGCQNTQPFSPCGPFDTLLGGPQPGGFCTTFSANFTNVCVYPTDPGGGCFLGQTALPSVTGYVNIAIAPGAC